MKDLVNELIKPFLLEEKKEIVALYAGGFKPPTAGHLLVVEEALAKYPEIDKFIVVVGTGVRDEIDQEESLLVWEIYQNYLPMKVEIMPAKKPAIGEVYSYAKEHPEQTIYWVIGGREGREDDLNDIAVRTRAIDKAEDKYNNVEVKIITTPDSQMSGTNARKALLANDKEAFFKFLPARVKEKEEIFTILRPAALNEDLTFEKKRALIKKIIQMARSTGDLTSLDKLADMIAHKIVVPTEKKPAPGEFKVIGAKPMQGARWEEVLACLQHYGCRGTLVVPSTLKQVKGWTDLGKPVLISWNPEGREWSHASLIFDVVEKSDGNMDVYIADPNIPDPDQTVRIVDSSTFYSKWVEKWPNYMVRRPALMVDREVNSEGRQVMASQRKRKGF